MVALIIALVAIAAVVGLLFIIGVMYRRVGPNEALIVYGWGGTQIVTGGGKLVVPLFKACEALSLELMSFDVAPEQDLYTKQGVAVSVEAVAQMKVKSDPESIRTASEQLLNKPQKEREALIRLVMEGHLRGIVGILTIEQIVKEPEMVGSRVRETVALDLSKMGLEVVSFTIKKVTDEQGYITNMGKPDVARVKREAEIAQAEAERDIAIKRASAEREAAVAKAEADQARVIAQAQSETRQAEANRDLELKKAEYEASVNEQKALAEKAYDIASNQAQQKVMAEQVRIDQVQKQELIRVQELEVQRRQLELEATVIRQSEAEQRKIEIMAEAERQKLAKEAAGRAEATREQGKADAEVSILRGKAEADIVRAKGESEAEVVRAKGQAEADAMQLRADAYQKYNEKAILDRIVGELPAIATAFAEAYNKVDKIVMVSTGDGRQSGPSALSGEMTKMIAQIPDVIEALTGLSINDALAKLGKPSDVSQVSSNMSSEM